MIALVRTTLGSATDAERLARACIDQRLAACATITAGRSIYRWQGAVADEAESILLFKTRADLGEVLAAHIARLHPYELPVIERWEATVDAPALAWIDSETRG